MAKRPEKKITVSFITSMFAALDANVPGITLDSIKAQFDFGHYFLYGKEVDPLVEKLSAEDENFNAELFRERLELTEVVKAGSAPAFGGSRVTRINSKERAEQVANDPEDVDTIVEIITAMVQLRDKLNPLISEHASFGLAVKNKKVEVAVEETPIEDVPEVDEDGDEIPDGNDLMLDEEV